ncbi:MAG: ABC transporter permease subunit [Thermoplasmata archaeon]|nr:ABC transporter permease subunit [Thermoplasmata archaeon]
MALSTHDYRPYKGSYKGLGYRTFRMFRSNFISTIKNPAVIVVMSISFLFAFFYLMGLGLGGTTLSSSPEDDFLGQADVRLKVTPVDDGPLMREVQLGDQISFEFRVRNTGKETGNVLTYGEAPNDRWSVSTTILNGDAVLRPGEEIDVRMDISIPHHIGDFTYIEEMDQWDGGGKEPYDDGTGADRSGDSTTYIDIYPQNRGISHTFDLFNVTRDVMFYAGFVDDYMKNDISMDPSSEHFNPYWLANDIRTGSITTLISLEKSEYLSILEVENVTVFDPGSGSFSLEIGSNGKDVERSIKGGGSAEFPLTVENTGDMDILIVLDCYVTMYSDRDWECTVLDLPVDPFMGKPYIQLGAGEKRDLTLKVRSSNHSIERSFNIIVVGTEIGNGSYHHSSISNGIVTVNEARTTDSTNKEIFNMTWGSYERYFWIIFLASVAGAGLISNDIRYNSISLYLSRPITKVHYVLSKFVSLFTVLSLITVIPAVLFFTAGMAFGSAKFSFVLEHLWILGALFLSYFFALTVFTSICLALSSLMKRGIYAGAAIFSIFAFSSTISWVLHGLFKKDYLKLISIHDNFVVIFKVLFDIDFNARAYGYDWYSPAAVLLCLTLASWAIIIYRMKKVEGA